MDKMYSEFSGPENALLGNNQKKSTNRLRTIAVLLGAGLIVSVLVALSLAIGLGVESVAFSGSNEVCMSEECVALSSQISKYLDTSVDPCDDFYQFTCHGFEDNAIIPFGKESVSTLSEIRSVNVERIRSLMESGNNRSLNSLQSTITYYQSCMNILVMEQQSASELNTILHTLGGWPLVGIDLGTRWNINDENGYLSEQLYGSTAFLQLGVLPYVKNSTRNILYIMQGGLSIRSKLFYDNNSTRKLFVGVLEQIFKSINSSLPVQSYVQAAQEVLEFETKIAEITDFTMLITQPMTKVQLTTYSSLQTLLPEYNWTKILQFWGQLGDFSIDPSDPVGIIAPTNYLQEMNDLIRTTDKRILQNYAKWHFLSTFLQDLSEPFRKIYFTIQSFFTGKFVVPPRYVYCVADIQEGFRYPVARAFTEEYVNPRIMGNLSIILSDLKTALGQRIKGMNWLDDATKERALNKLSLIGTFIAYPREILSDNYLDTLYNFAISPTSGHFMNKLTVTRWWSVVQLSLLGKTNSRQAWILNSLPPTIVNAFYSPHLNQIYVLEGILETPVYKQNWPDYFKYAAIGYIVGHEYTHGFDASGQNFDEVGNLVDWWTSSSQEEFDKRTSCFIEQYSQYTVKAGKVNGNLTLSENIADNGGLAAAYLAYKNKNSKEKTLPGLPYTQEQLFFIGASQVWCHVATLADQSRRLRTDVHSPSSIRPIGVMSNSEAFAAAFNCPVGARMNPEKKCELW